MIKHWLGLFVLAFAWTCSGIAQEPVAEVAENTAAEREANGDGAIEPLHPVPHMGWWSYTSIGSGVEVRTVTYRKRPVADHVSVGRYQVAKEEAAPGGVTVYRQGVEAGKPTGEVFAAGDEVVPMTREHGAIEVGERKPVRHEWNGRQVDLVEQTVRMPGPLNREQAFRIFHHPELRTVGRTMGMPPGGQRYWLEPSVVRVESGVERGGAGMHSLIEVGPRPVPVTIAGKRFMCWRQTRFTEYKSPDNNFAFLETLWMSAEMPGLLVKAETREDGPRGTRVNSIVVTRFGENLIEGEPKE